MMNRLTNCVTLLSPNWRNMVNMRVKAGQKADRATGWGQGTELEPETCHWEIGREETESNEVGARKKPEPGDVRKIVFAAIVVMLFAAPVFLLLTAISAPFPLRDALAANTMYWFPGWAVFTVWVALDASALFGFAGPRPDPFGPRALGLSAL